MTDLIADMLTRVRNALAVRHENVIMPASKMRVAIAQILKNEGFIRDYEMLRGQPHPTLRVYLTYLERREPAINGLKRVSKPGLRIYVGKGEIPRIFGGVGIAILSTSRGVMTGSEAWRMGIGGELMCYVW